MTHSAIITSDSAGTYRNFSADRVNYRTGFFFIEIAADFDEIYALIRQFFGGRLCRFQIFCKTYICIAFLISQLKFLSILHSIHYNDNAELFERIQSVQLLLFFREIIDMKNLHIPFHRFPQPLRPLIIKSAA